MSEKYELFIQYETIIDKINEILKAFDENQQENIKVALLIGNTGSGKSTLFNFLAGFELKIKYEKNKKYVGLKYSNQQGASIMKEGLASVTREPNYYYNKDNHYLLIDFPGFNDTQGPMQRAFIDILFNRLVMKSQVKVIHVVKLWDDEFPNRARDLQSFINQYIGSSHQDFSKVVLFCNYWSEEEVEEYQKQLLKESLIEIYNQDFENIELIQRIKSEEDFQTKLNQQKRQNLWKIIQKSQTIQLKPALFQHQSEIAIKIKYKCLDTILNIVTLLVNSLKENLETLKKVEIESLLSCFLEMDILIKYKINQDAFAWYQEIIKQCIKTAEILKQNYVEEKENKAFLKVFEFLSQQKQIINIESILEQNSQIIKDQLITQKQTILNQIILLEKREQPNNYHDLNIRNQIFQQIQYYQIVVELQIKNGLLENDNKLLKQENQQIYQQLLNQQNQNKLNEEQRQRSQIQIQKKEENFKKVQDQKKQQFLEELEETKKKQQQEKQKKEEKNKNVGLQIF